MGGGGVWEREREGRRGERGREGRRGGVVGREREGRRGEVVREGVGSKGGRRQENRTVKRELYKHYSLELRKRNFGKSPVWRSLCCITKVDKSFEPSQ